jgi:hypothetical protein
MPYDNGYCLAIPGEWFGPPAPDPDFCYCLHMVSEDPFLYPDALQNYKVCCTGAGVFNKPKTQAGQDYCEATTIGYQGCMAQ